MQACEGRVRSTSSTGCCFVLEDLSDADIDEDLNFLYGGDSSSSGICFIEEYCPHEGNEEPNLGGDAYCA
ncbi:hypothetical protein DPMN_138888 [Dreissena polymorpha]|uniref:Uncharacterized protein n=1 Tax=Dreissena polymorpha TaxID=45954 RepID=A0A9D4G848_DREPO|nr:hypothetical protein DPMN_138888 [Dreissena polymorpha]